MDCCVVVNTRFVSAFKSFWYEEILPDLLTIFGHVLRSKPILNIRMFSKRDAFLRFFIVVGGPFLPDNFLSDICPLDLLHALPPNFFTFVQCISLKLSGRLAGKIVNWNCGNWRASYSCKPQVLYSSRCSRTTFDRESTACQDPLSLADATC
jgi:hypothetical protein